MKRKRIKTLCLGWAVCVLALGVYAADKEVPNAAVPWLIKAEHQPRQPRTGEQVTVTAQTHPRVSVLNLQYQVVDPGSYIEYKDPAFTKNWNYVPMTRRGSTNNAVAFVAELPGDLQKHRRLIRYRLAGTDASGKAVSAPVAEGVPNYGYFTYDGIPAWAGAIDPRSRDPELKQVMTFPSNVMSRVQAYHFIGKRSSVENVTWREQDGGQEYRYTGTMVVDGEVYDHVGYRARGGVWRYAMGKNMWKFDFPNGNRLRAKDDFGRPYPVEWDKLNLRSCIQQGDYGHRGEQGLFETVGFRLFNLADVPAPFTHWLQLRIISEAKENPADQYRGDFWGLYLAIENEDGRFLKAHGLPDGNVYKMEMGGGELDHQGAGAVSNRSDLVRFMSGYRTTQPESWWRANLDLPSYYSYRTICECIHHYDIGAGKNYDYYFNPVTRKWQVFPWDIDLTWANNMFGDGEEPFKRRVLTREVFRIEYQNRLRELRDLLFNPEQTGQLIDEYAAVIWDPSGGPSVAEADRRKWDYHPAMANGWKAGHGLFYQAGRPMNLGGMARLMKAYVRKRGAWIDSTLLNDPKIPSTPSVTSACPPQFPLDQLRFRMSGYEGANAFAALKWRLGEITATNAAAKTPRMPRVYEITPVWESGELDEKGREIVLPKNIAQAGRLYRVRARVEDATGRWSHWSQPVEFVAGKPKE